MANPELKTAAPIALFVYNRPWHTEKTVESLQKNDLAAESDLFIFSDAPKTHEVFEKVEEVREFIHNLTGFKSVTIFERKNNLGLASSIIDGVTSLCREYGRVIVLEDDLITSPFFLRFMNDALDLYADTPEVMHISGCLYPIDNMSGETFFFRVPLCWGWATWHCSWRLFRKDNDVMLRFDSKMRREFSFNSTYHYWQQLESNNKGLIDTWFVYWYASLFLNNGLALYPSRSLVLNIGFDGTGVHCGVSDNLAVALSPTPILVERMVVTETAEAVEKHIQYFLKSGAVSSSRSLRQLTMRTYRILKNKVQFILDRQKKMFE